MVAAAWDIPITEADEPAPIPVEDEVRLWIVFPVVVKTPELLGSEIPIKKLFALVLSWVRFAIVLLEIVLRALEEELKIPVRLDVVLLLILFVTEGLPMVLFEMV